MGIVTTFLIGLGITVVSAILVVAYLRRPLKSILVDLCGTEERAWFWTAFSNVTLTLVPTIFALHHRPQGESFPSLVFELGAQLEGALIGLVVSVVVLGFVLSAFIPRRIAQPDKAAKV